MEGQLPPADSDQDLCQDQPVSDNIVEMEPTTTSTGDDGTAMSSTSIQLESQIQEVPTEEKLILTEISSTQLPVDESLDASIPVTSLDLTTEKIIQNEANGVKSTIDDDVCMEVESTLEADNVQNCDSSSINVEMGDFQMQTELVVSNEEGNNIPVTTEQAEVNPNPVENNHEEEAEPVIDSSYYFWKYNISIDKPPKCLVQTCREDFSSGPERGRKAANFLKGCKWAPDGSCLLSCSDDDTLRLYNFPASFSSIQDWNTSEDEDLDKEDWKSVLKIKEGGLIYDYCWYPLMSSMDPVSACLLTTSSLSPIHLWDAFTGKLRATYHPYNHLDQVISAYSLAFGTNGETIYSGFEKTLRIFNLTRPGRECIERKLKQPLSELNQYGIISSIAVNPCVQSFYALGSFDKSVGLYYEDGSVICLLQGHAGGVTHMKFSTDGMKLFTGGRMDSRLMCWDMRQMGEAYKIYDRVVQTHQRVYFDVSADNKYLVTGGTDGIVKIWNVQNNEDEPCCSFRGNTDCINGASLNPYVPLLATSSGQRHFPEVVDDSDDEDLFTHSKTRLESSCDIKLWKLT